MGKIIITPQKKLFRLLWTLLGILILTCTFAIFKILATGKILTYTSLFISSFTGVIFLYIKSILNYYSLVIENKTLFIYKFKQLIHKAPAKAFTYKLEELDKPKNFKRIKISWKEESISISNLEFNNFDYLLQELKKLRSVK